MDIWFLRHGRSRADDEGRIEGRYDSPLTEVGRSQARDLATRWSEQGHRFDKVICSTLRRASETAKIVGRALGSPVECDPNWQERANGPMAGLLVEECEDLYPIPEFMSPFQKIADGCESACELQSRATRALQAVVDRGPGRYLVVSHGGVLNAALRSVVGAAPQAAVPGVILKFGDTGHVETTYDPVRHKWTILRFEPGPDSGGVRPGAP